MAGRPKTRAMVDAEIAAAREVRAWRDAQQAELDAREDLTASERESAERQLLREYGTRALAAMAAARRQVRRDIRAREAAIDRRERPSS